MPLSSGPDRDKNSVEKKNTFENISPQLRDQVEAYVDRLKQEGLDASGLHEALTQKLHEITDKVYGDRYSESMHDTIDAQMRDAPIINTESPMEIQAVEKNFRGGMAAIEKKVRNKIAIQDQIEGGEALNRQVEEDVAELEEAAPQANEAVDQEDVMAKLDLGDEFKEVLEGEVLDDAVRKLMNTIKQDLKRARFFGGSAEIAALDKETKEIVQILKDNEVETKPITVVASALRRVKKRGLQ